MKFYSGEGSKVCNYIFYLEIRHNYGLFANFILPERLIKTAFKPDSGNNFFKCLTPLSMRYRTTV